MSAEQTTLGKLIGPDAGRDAVHVAVAPCKVVGVSLLPGQRARLVDGSTDLVQAAYHGQEWHGIVDPFLDEAVSEGQWVYLCIRPGTITGLRHVWKHPAFARKGA